MLTEAELCCSVSGQHGAHHANLRCRASLPGKVDTDRVIFRSLVFQWTTILH